MRKSEEFDFTESPLFKDYRSYVKGVIRLPKMSSLMLSGYQKLTKACMTFTESCHRTAENSPLGLMQRSSWIRRAYDLCLFCHYLTLT